MKKLKYLNLIDHVIWKAELTKKGRLHFHLVTDGYIEKNKLKNLWNNALAKHNNTNERFIINQNYNPPSTHIKKIYYRKKMIAELSKYATKNVKYPSSRAET